MRILKFFTFLWTCSICSQVFSSKNEHQIHSQFRRYQRAANVPVYTTKLAKIVANHMKIARIANGMYIQKGLSERKFSNFDLVASIWNLKDKTTLEMLNEFPVDKLSTHLTGLKTVMEGISGLEDVKMDEIEQKLRPLRDMKPTIETMKTAVAWSNFPEFITDPPQLSELNTRNSAEECAGKLIKIQNATAANKTTSDYRTWLFNSLSCLMDIMTWNDKFSTIIKKIDSYLNANDNDRMLKPLMDGINSKKAMDSNATNLANIDTTLAKIEAMFGKVERLVAMSTSSAELHGMIAKVTDAIEDVGSYGLSEIGLAFAQEQNLNSLSSDVKDTWVLDILNNGKALETIEAGLETLNSLSAPVSSFSEGMRQLTDEHIVGTIRLVEKVSANLKLPKSAKFSKLSELRGCFANTTTIPSAATDIATFVTKLNDLRQPLTEMKATLSGVKTNATLLDSLRLALSVYEVDRTKKYDARLMQEVIASLTILKNQTDEILALFRTHSTLDSIKPLNNVNPQIKQMKDWINSTQLLNTAKCDFADVNALAVLELLELLELTITIKANNGLEKFGAIGAGLTQSTEALKKMKELKVPSVHFAAVDDLVLREVFIPIATLQQLTRVHENSLDLGGVVNSEPIIRAAISRVSNAQDQNNLTATWNTFPASVTALNELSGKLIELEKKLKDPPETSLDGVTNTYESAKGMSFGGKINLRPYLLSFKLLDSTVEVQNIEKSFKEIDTPSLAELDLAPAKFSKLTASLNKLVGQAGTFSEKKDADGPSNILLFVIIGILVVLIIVSLVTAFMIYRHCTKTAEFIPGKKYSMKIATGTGPAEQPFTSIIDGMELYMISFAKMQDVRLEINRKDPKTNSTKLYTAVMNKNWNLVRELLAKGALVDVLGGSFQRTALHEMVLAIDFEHATWLLDKGAWIMQPDRTGDFPETWADSNGFHEMFNKYQHGRELRRLIPPFTPRTFNVLVLNPYCMAVWRRRKLPERIKNKITWGYNYSKDVDLNAFTHIVVPKYYCSDTTTLDVGDDDLFPFKLVASWGMLLHESWLEDMINDPDAIDEDEFWYLTNMKYREKVYQDSLFKIKVDIHMGRPGFLYQARITILETKDEKRAKQKEEWEEIIEMFGGTNAKQVVGDVDENAMPYNTLYSWYNNHWEWQNGCWILKFEDSKIDPIWRSSHEVYTLVPFHFLPTAIAGYYIPNALNTEIPLDCIRNDNKKNNVKSERKKRPKSSRSETSLQPVGISKMAAVRKSSGAKSESSNSKKSETSKSKTTVSSS